MDYLTVDEAAAELGISSRRVQQLISAGELRAEKRAGVWLIPKDALEAVRTRRKPGRPKRNSG